MTHINSMISQVMHDYIKYSSSCENIAKEALDYIYNDDENVTNIEVECEFNKSNRTLELNISYYEYDYGYRNITISVENYFNMVEKFKIASLDKLTMYYI